MGFLREWYRDFCVERGPKRARMLLADGEYADAASEFRSHGMHRQAADAYMKAGKQTPDNYYYEWAAEDYEKAGSFELMRKACENNWKSQGDVDVKRLATHGQLEQFCNNVRTHKPDSLSSCLEHAKEWKLAGDMCIAASEQIDQETTLKSSYRSVGELKYYHLVHAIEYYLKAGLSDDKLFDLHKEAFRADVERAKGESDLLFHVADWQWVIKSDNLRKFIDDLIDKFPVCLWHMLWEGNDHLSEDVIKEHEEELAKSLLQCVKKSESKASLGKNWGEFMGTIGKDKLYYSYTARRLSRAGFFIDAAEMFVDSATQSGYEGDLKDAIECYKKANQPIKVAEILERLGKYKEAAGLAEDAGNKKLAIRFYEQALKKEGISDTEAEWVKMVLKRFHKKEDEPFAAKTKPSKTPPPEDYKKKTPKEPTETSVPRDATVGKQSNVPKKDYKEEPVEQFQGAPYTLTPAKEEDIRWIADKVGKIYGSDDAIPVEVKLFWFRKNPNGFWIIKDHTGKPIGSCELLPLKKDILEKMMSVGIKRREISPDDIYSPKEIKEADCIYIENIMALREDNTANPWVFKECLKKIPHVIDCLGVLSDNVKIYAMPIKEFRTAKGVRRSTSERLLQELGFWKVTKKRKQRCSLYCAELERFLSSSDFCRDGSKKAPERRKGTKSRKKNRASEKAATKFRLWKSPSDTCFVIVGNRVKFYHKGELTDLRLKSFGKTHNVFSEMYGKGLRSEDAKLNLCPDNTKPHDFFRNINRELNNKIAKLGVSGVPNDVEFIQYLPESREYKFAIPVMCVEEDDLKSEIFDG